MGVAFLFLFSANTTQQMIEETVIDSISNDTTNSFDQRAGYYR
jgi:hypothetical protein